MGEQSAKEVNGGTNGRSFMKALLRDMRALETMLDKGMFETRNRRIGAEQEMFLVDRDLRPAPVAAEILEENIDPRIVGELARFNLEAVVRRQQQEEDERAATISEAQVVAQ